MFILKVCESTGSETVKVSRMSGHLIRCREGDVMKILGQHIQEIRHIRPTFSLGLLWCCWHYCSVITCY